MLCRILELAEEDVRVAEIGVGATLGRLVARVARDVQPLRVVAYGACKVPEQIARIAQIATSAARRRAVAQRTHQL